MQRDLILRGCDAITRMTDGIRPLFFAPSNHLYNEDTLEVAAEEGYTYFGDRAFMNMPAYTMNGLMVMPEASLEKGKLIEAPSYYIHYDKIQGNEPVFYRHLDSATSLSDVKVSEVSDSLLKSNHRRKIMWKVERDITRFPSRFVQSFRAKR